MSIPMTAPQNASSMIALIGTDERNLLVRFNKGQLYSYADAADHCTAMLTADSAGKYFLANVKPNYSCTQLDG